VRVLVTGAGGFIGSRLVEKLAREHTVYGLVRSVTAGASPSGGVQTIVCDLTRPLAEADLPTSVDAVVHLAQSRLHRDFPASVDDLFGVNIHATQRLLDYAREAGASRFVLASSGGVHGYSTQPITEDSSLDPTGYYLITKSIGELLLKSYREYFSTSVLRPFFVYGSGQAPYMFLPRLARSIVERRPIYLHGADGLRMNPIHVTDAARAFAQAINLDGHHVVSIGGPDVVSLREVAEAMASRLGNKPLFEAAPAGPPGDIICDLTRMINLFGAPRERFWDHLPEVCDDVLATQPEAGSR
jgi:UDP-glucose 4-epimerase